MNIHEYQPREILGSYSIPIPQGLVALSSDQVERAAKMMGGRYVVKAQIYAGGSGKAGGVKLVHHPEALQEHTTSHKWKQGLFCALPRSCG